MMLLREDMTLAELDDLEREGWDVLKPDAQSDIWALAREAVAAREEERRRQDADLDAPTAATPAGALAAHDAPAESLVATLRGAMADDPYHRAAANRIEELEAALYRQSAVTPTEARAMFGARLEDFARTLGGKAKDLDIPGFACIVMTDAGINVVSGGTHDEWRPMMRRIAGRVSDEMGQVLIAKGVATKPGRG